MLPLRAWYRGKGHEQGVQATVALDADVVIAFLDASDDQHQRAIDLLRPRLATGDRMLLAASVYAEILVHPIKRAADKAIDEFITAIGAEIIAIDRDIARRAAELRASHSSLRLPDASRWQPLPRPAPTC